MRLRVLAVDFHVRSFSNLDLGFEYDSTKQKTKIYKKKWCGVVVQSLVPCNARKEGPGVAAQETNTNGGNHVVSTHRVSGSKPM